MTPWIDLFLVTLVQATAWALGACVVVLCVGLVWAFIIEGLERLIQTWRHP